MSSGRSLYHLYPKEKHAVMRSTNFDLYQLNSVEWVCIHKTNVTNRISNIKKDNEKFKGQIKNQNDGSGDNLQNSSNQQENPKSSNELYDNLLKLLRSKMTLAQLKTNDLATSDDTSIWLLYLPLKGERFSLTKREFFDAVLLKYESEKISLQSKIQH